MTVHSVAIRLGLIVVEVDRYTFVYTYDIGPGGQIEMSEISGQVHGKNHTTIDRHDQVAKQARREASDQAASAIRAWLLEHPTEHLAEVVDRVIWLNPAHEPPTPEQAEINKALVDEMVKKLSAKMRMPDGCNRRRPLP